ncbi:LuxR family transcriptional regulator (plasmid) [Sinorhizobium medicae]|uniref:helix-turn-helix transcriptional regulator n=1 Tax=Sinorhizobium medicae TaxID=110321 RepID=UPI00299D0E9D|nr:LuxR family transcriptional regulator [Sinorhizobium medicae]MDX0265964.1 LuxR family transcriptional regulator [Sinorhizobium meliloti]MDX0353361.1 LuxR family transcriptional regulator [Sinorhizobium meliloti]WQO62190.1 LuxR family transcriptional regulator [Sinorhizobium medicae]
MTTESEAGNAFSIFIHQMLEETSIDQMVENVSLFARSFNCSSISYGPQPHVQTVQRESRIKLPTLLTYPKEWQEHCFKSGYDRLAPGLRVSPFQSSPILWDQAYKDLNTTDRERRIFDEAKEFGLQTGVTIPLRGRLDDFPIMSFVQSETSGLSKFAVSWLTSAAFLFHDRVEGRVELKADVPSLTAREKECLTWVRQGKSSWTIGTILEISPHTVDFHIKHAKSKLGAENRRVAAMEAERLGLIKPKFWLL